MINIGQFWVRKNDPTFVVEIILAKDCIIWFDDDKEYKAVVYKATGQGVNPRTGIRTKDNFLNLYKKYNNHKENMK